MNSGLFLCTGSFYRSRFAEEYFNRRANMDEEWARRVEGTCSRYDNDRQHRPPWRQILSRDFANLASMRRTHSVPDQRGRGRPLARRYAVNWR